MGVRAEDFARALHALTPRGPIWPDGFRPGSEAVSAPEADYGTVETPGGDPNDQGTVTAPSGPDQDFGEVGVIAAESVQSRVFLGMGDELALLQARIDQFVELELDPATAVELLPEWERVLGLPDPCVTGAQTLEERQLAAAAKLRATGGQSRSYFLGIAEAAGAEVSIVEHDVLRAGFRAGDRCTSVNWLHVWDVAAPLDNLEVMRAGFRAGDRLRTWGNPTLECSIGPLAPAHTRVRFVYGTQAAVSSELDFGTVDNPAGQDLDFGTVAAPTGVDIDEGSI